MFKRKRLITYIVFLLLGYMTISVGRSLFEVYRVGRRVSRLEDDVVAMQDERDMLQAQKDDLLEPDYIEREARNKLNLIKPGDVLAEFAHAPSGVVSETESSVKDLSQAINKEWVLLFRRGLKL